MRGFLIVFLYCSSSTVVPTSSPITLPSASHPTSHPQSYPPLALSMGPLYFFLDDPSSSSSFTFGYSNVPSSLIEKLFFFLYQVWNWGSNFTNLFFFCKIVSAILHPLKSHINFKMCLSISEENLTEILIRIVFTL